MSFENTFGPPNEDSSYRSAPHPEVQKALGVLTEGKDWDYSRFRSVLLSLAKIGSAQAIPASNSPDSIDVSGWTPYVDELQRRTGSNGKEHARAVIADTSSLRLLMSPVIAGTDNNVSVHFILPAEQAKFQKAIAYIHTHTNDMTAHGLSDGDYRTFLFDPDQQAMLLAYGNGNRIMILKTSVTPNNLSRERIATRILDAREDYFLFAPNPVSAVVDFNRAVCSEYGLVMYKSVEG
ncbi:MAG: hypothetical protein WC243_04210, partial [Patescibacteria group bacterium]